MVVTGNLLVLTCDQIESLIVDIDQLQSHGKVISRTMKCSAHLLAGINAADITKLKNSGFYTVAVQFLSSRASHSISGD
jgi:hypothetical protein